MPANLSLPVREMKKRPAPRFRNVGRALGYAAAALALPVIAAWAPQALALRSGYEHALFDLGIALSACFCSLQAFVRYESRPQPVFLWLGAGFLASGLLDGLHATLSFELHAGGDHAGPWAWTASSMLLATYIALSLGLDRPAESKRLARINFAIVGGITAVALALLAGMLLAMPWKAAILAKGPLHRPAELVPAWLMAVALGMLWKQHALLDAPLRRRLGIALVLYASLHGFVLPWSAEPLGTSVGLAHVAKLVAHWLVLVGLLESSTTLLTEVQTARQRLVEQADELEASERHIRSIVDHAPYAILSADEGGAIRSINPLAAQLYGIPQPQAVGRSLASFFEPQLAAVLEEKLGSEQSVRARLMQARQAHGEESTWSRRALSRETVGVRADGSTFPAALTLTDAVAGGQRFLTAFVRDLTRAIEQEQKTQQALSLATQILDQSGAAICSTDASGLITRFNRTAQQWLGWAPAEVVGRFTPASFVDKTELQQRGAFLEKERGMPLATDAEVFLALARSGSVDQREWTLVRKDGTRFPAHVAVARLADDEGQVTGFVLVASDLSHHKEVERMKDEFVSAVSHELRTPLTSVRGSLGLIAGGVAGKLPPQAQSLLEIAQRNTERLILLINDILDMEKIEAGKMRFNFKSVELDAVAAEAVQAAEGLAATRSIRLARRGRAPGVRVHADDHRVLQVLGNLLSNAIKFSPERGTVEVDITAEAGRVRLSVSDHGGGIPEAAQPRIFQKFFQADSSSSRQQGGSGLGLSICKALIERMDGSMGFRSRPGETVFWFDLPQEAGGDGRASAARILVVEDDADAAAVLGQILRQAGYETDMTRSAAEAFELLGRRHYDGMTLDILLPDRQGAALLAEVRRHPRARQLPIVVISIYEADAQLHAAADAARVADWLTKPIDGQKLLAAVRRALPAPPAPTETEASHGAAAENPAG